MEEQLYKIRVCMIHQTLMIRLDSSVRWSYWLGKLSALDIQSKRVFKDFTKYFIEWAEMTRLPDDDFTITFEYKVEGIRDSIKSGFQFSIIIFIYRFPYTDSS